MNIDYDEPCWVYHGHIVMCDPTPKDGGGFRANAAAIRIEDERTVIASSPDEVSLISRRAAVDYAAAWIRNWIDKNP